MYTYEDGILQQVPSVRQYRNSHLASKHLKECYLLDVTKILMQGERQTTPFADIRIPDQEMRNWVG